VDLQPTIEEPAADAAGAADASARLRAVAGELRRFLSGSEDVFLDAGRRVTDLEQRARALIDGAHATGAFRTTSGQEDPVAVLGRELARMDAHLRGSREAVAGGAQQLAALLAEIEVLLRTQSHFETMPPTLRMLGLNTRIENARADAQYTGMETVALEVRRLGDEVEPKFRGVFERALHLLETVRTALATAQAFTQGQGAACGMLEQTQGALASLREMTAAGGAIADRALAASEQLKRDLGALLVALQGHDATRQAIEHVVEGLAELEAEASRDGEQAARAHRADALRVMAAQLRGARERHAAALDGVSRSLRAFSGVGAELSRETARFVAGGSGAAATQQVRATVDHATHCLLQHVAHETATGHSMDRVAGTVEEMSRSVKDILGIGSAVKIIALNALVETERAGQGGRVLAVLAQGIGTLAGEVVQRTAEISRSLRAISDLAGALHGAGAGKAATEGEAIAGGLERLSLRLSEIQRGLEAAVTTMGTGSRALGAEVEALAARVAEALAEADRLADAETTLAALAEEAGGGAAADPAADAARAYARYTMASEREIHDRVVRGLESPGATAPAGGDDLGSNVELF
jgi:methyl-accepting chemotaxis protein